MLKLLRTANGDVAIIRLAKDTKSDGSEAAALGCYSRALCHSRACLARCLLSLNGRSGVYIWLVEQPSNALNGMYEKVQVNTVGPVFVGATYFLRWWLRHD